MTNQTTLVTCRQLNVQRTRKGLQSLGLLSRCSSPWGNGSHPCNDNGPRHSDGRLGIP
ncbi:uncharacterized protein EI90DRAFT_3051814 [Cantharellus anzutake]|uniref:uncharacterized protein n=1 Tax=Cantharellus anzutake TaxID=1750568 RepID=UPI001904C8ED|nr:uncharacterized protein EI90DRAFT_3051814 [Cantharellus anzutake]KAF8334321.1 hypothetical protein EI90DRAFT_3051814 [Cantharellus anzutake]